MYTKTVFGGKPQGPTTYLAARVLQAETEVEVAMKSHSLKIASPV